MTQADDEILEGLNKFLDSMKNNPLFGHQITKFAQMGMTSMTKEFTKYNFDMLHTIMRRPRKGIKMRTKPKRMFPHGLKTVSRMHTNEDVNAPYNGLETTMIQKDKLRGKRIKRKYSKLIEKTFYNPTTGQVESHWVRYH